VIEFVETQLKQIERRLAEQYDFKVKDHNLDIIGYCSECKDEIET
jgi:Fe2+ or Zn2+ uptake regulation protein